MISYFVCIKLLNEVSSKSFRKFSLLIFLLNDNKLLRFSSSRNANTSRQSTSFTNSFNSTSTQYEGEDEMINSSNPLETFLASSAKQKEHINIKNIRYLILTTLIKPTTFLSGINEIFFNL